MKHFATALSEIIERSFDGNRTSLAKLADVSPSTIIRFCSGEVEPTTERLSRICSLLSRMDRKQLLMAAARDAVPAEYQDEVFGDEDPASALLRAKLSPDLTAVIRYLESNAMTDPLTAGYLRRIGNWVGISGSSSGQLSMVAEDEKPYGSPKRDDSASSAKYPAKRRKPRILPQPPEAQPKTKPGA